MKIFIAGPRAISKLNSKIIERIDNIIDNNYTILVGDANGVDKTIQYYCNEQNYDNVIVYTAGKNTRNNIGGWQTINVESEKNVKGFEFYKLKDEQMAKDADYGLMIWNGKSRGTFNNILNLVNNSKTVLLYLTTVRKFYKIKNNIDIERLLNLIKNEDIKKFYLNEKNKITQLVMEIY